MIFGGWENCDIEGTAAGGIHFLSWGMYDLNSEGQKLHFKRLRLKATHLYIPVLVWADDTRKDNTFVFHSFMHKFGLHFTSESDW